MQQLAKAWYQYASSDDDGRSSKPDTRHPFTTTSSRCVKFKMREAGPEGVLHGPDMAFVKRVAQAADCLFVQAEPTAKLHVRDPGRTIAFLSILEGANLFQWPTFRSGKPNAFRR